jgi:hypothetical protein
MTHEDIYTKISNIATDNFNIKAIEKLLLNEILGNVRKGLNTSNNKITGLSSSAGRMISDSIRALYDTNQYKNSLASLLSDVQGLGVSKVGVYVGDGLEVAISDLSEAQSVAYDSLLDSLNESGLNQRFNQPIRQLIYQNVRDGASQTVLEKAIKSYVLTETGSKSELNRYINSVSIQSADAYSSAIDQEVYKRFKPRLTHIRVVGSLIDTSSRQCRRAVLVYDREIPIDKLDEWIAYAKENGASQTLNANNLSSLKAHYGCRHQFVPVILNNKK